MNLDWAKNFTGDLKIVFYDDLVIKVEETLRDILRFINYDVDEVSKYFYMKKTVNFIINSQRLC